jgi:hypothetical protein
MIPCSPAPEPADFDQACRQPGNAWLVAHPNATRPRDYWSRFKPELAAAFRQLCAYTAVYEPVGTIDHYLSWDLGGAAYEWGNYRYASQWINSSKQTADGLVLDPFEVGEDWFEILLPSLQLRLTDQVPATHRSRAEFTLERLHLRDDERVIRSRRSWFELFQGGELTLAGLLERAPLIARAVEQLIFHHLWTASAITSRQTAHLCFVSVPRAKRLLDELREQGRLGRTGRGQGVRYALP